MEQQTPDLPSAHDAAPRLTVREQLDPRYAKMLRAAEWLAEHGAIIGRAPIADGKAPQNRWKAHTTDEPSMVRGIVTGAHNSLVIAAGRLVIPDLDKPGWHQRFLDAGLPPTFTVKTPSRRVDPATGEIYDSLHVYGLVPEGFDVLTLPGTFAGGEVRRSVAGEQSMVLGPYAKRPDGIYLPLVDAPRVLGTFPLAVLQLIIDNPAAKPRDTNGAALGDMGEWVWDVTSMGSRHDHLRDKVRYWVGLGIRGQTLRSNLIDYIARHAVPETGPDGRVLDAAELERMCAGAEAKFADDPPNITLTLGDRPVVADDGLRLPNAFWEARPYLGLIRQAALSRLLAPDAVLGAVLARLASRIPHAIGLPAMVGTEVGLSLLVGLLGPSGAGKSGAAHLSAALLGTSIADDGASGSGEGLSEMFMGWEGAGKNKVRKQVLHNIFVYSDEGEKLIAQATRPNGTTFPVWRSVFTGGNLSDGNASADRKRSVPAGSYSAGLLVAFQEDIMGPLLADIAPGTPQRLLYLSAFNDDFPDVPPDWPGTPDIDLDDLGNLPGLQVTGFGATYAKRVRFDPLIEAEVRAARDASRRDPNPDPWAAHRNLLRLKVAALLAFLDRRGTVGLEDWALSGMVADTSDANRRHAQQAVAAVSERSEVASGERHGRRISVSEETRYTRAVQRLQETLVEKVRKRPGELSKSDLRRTVRQPDRVAFDEAFASLKHAGRIVTREEPGQGVGKKRLYPGPLR